MRLLGESRKNTNFTTGVKHCVKMSSHISRPLKIQLAFLHTFSFLNVLIFLVWCLLAQSPAAEDLLLSSNIVPLLWSLVR